MTLDALVTQDERPPAALADQMFSETVRDGQSARQVADDAGADDLREALRALGRRDGVRLRTARVDGAVLVARLDALIWSDDQATMRAKLTPPG